MILNNLSMIAIPLVATGINVGLTPNPNNLCRLTKFTHNAMFSLFTVIFSYFDFFAKSNIDYVFNDSVTITGMYIYIFSVLIAVVLISINITLINQINQRPIRVISSFFVLLLSITLSIFTIYHEAILN